MTTERRGIFRMKRNVILYIGMSLDGYISGENGELDWLEGTEGVGDNGYSEFYETVDTVIMGNTTYQEVLGFDVPYPYTGIQNYVFSKTRTGRDEHVTFVNGDVKSFIAELKQQEGKQIWLVGGGKIVQSFLQEGLIDEMIISIAPIILGKGIPLFIGGVPETQYELKKAEQLNQFVQLTYEKKK